MTILLYGQDNFRSLQQLQKLKRAFRQKRNGDVIIIEADDFKMGRFKNHLNTQGLFRAEKLIILKNLLLEGNRDELKEIEQIIKQKPKETTVILYERSIVNQKDALFKKLSTLARIKGKQYYSEFKPLDHNQLRRWIVNQLSRAGKNIERAALNYLLEICVNSWQAHQEIGKLTVLAQNTITLDQIRHLVLAKSDDNIFNLTDALGQKDLARALQLLTTHLVSGTEPLYLLAMITRQIKILIKIKAAQARLGHSSTGRCLADEISEHPFVVQKILPTTRLFLLKELIDIHDRILETDQQLKSSRLSPRTLLTKLVYDIIKK